MSRPLVRLVAVALIASAGCGRGLSLVPGAVTTDASQPDDTAVPDAGDDPSAADPRSVGRTGRLCGVAGSGGLARLAVSPDHHLVALAYHRGRVDLHATADGTRMRSIAAHTGPITGAAFLPDGRLITAGGDGALRIWRVNDGALDRELRAPASGAPITRLEVSPDGTTAVALSQVTGNALLARREIQAWSTRDGALRWTVRHGAGGVVGRFHPLFALAEGIALRRDEERVEVLRWSDGQVLRPLFDIASELVTSPIDGRPLAEQLAAARRDGEPLRVPPPAGVSPDGRRALFNVSLRDEARTLVAHELTLLRLEDGLPSWRREIPAQPSGGSPVLVSAALAPAAGEVVVIFVDHVEVWDAADGRPLATAAISAATPPLAFGPSSTAWISTTIGADARGGGAVHWLTLRTGQSARLVEVEPGPRAPVRAMALVPGAGLAAVAVGNAVRMFDLDVGEQRFVVGDGARLATSSDGRFLASARSSTTYLSIFLSANGVPLQPIDGCPDSPMAFAPEGDAIWAMCGALARRRIGDGGVDLVVPDTAWPAAAAIAASPDGRLVAAAEDAGPTATPRLVVSNASTGARVWGSTDRAGTRFASLAFSPDSRRLVVTALRPRGAPAVVAAQPSHPDMAVYDAIDGRELHRIVDARGAGMSFSPDGSLLAAATQRGARVWRTADWTYLTVETIDGGPDGWSWNITPGFDRSGRLVTVDPWGVLRRYCDVGVPAPAR